MLLARAAGGPLDQLMATRLLAALGMHDTGFVAAPGRLPTCYATAESGLQVFDDDAASRWARPPAFPDARGGMVSIAADLLRVAAALFDGGAGVLGTGSIAALISDHLTAQQRRDPSAAAFLNGAGWGYGLEDSSPEQLAAGRPSRYGWGGGLGTLWSSWPDRQAAAVLLAQASSPSAPLFDACIAAAEATLGV